MKKVIAGLVAAVVFAGVAQAENVYSKNAVGFINVDAKANQLYALSIPFANMANEDGTWNFDETQIAQDAPKQSWVYFWDDGSQTWVPGFKRSSFSTKRQLKAGEFFFLKPAADVTLTMAGEVPDEDTLSVPVVGSANMTAVANPYPVPWDFDSSTLASLVGKQSWAYFWDEDAQVWVPAFKRSSFSSKQTVQPGRGLFIKSATSDASANWDTDKPYAFP